MPSAGPAADSPPGSTWPVTATAPALAGVLTGGKVYGCTMFTQVMAGLSSVGPGPGRWAPTDRVAYKRRNVVERCFNRLKQFRAIATRFDKTATSYRGLIDLATVLLWL